jgi:two-component system alkaline phosphatase synthesis response regulator PhoP
MNIMVKILVIEDEMEIRANLIDLLEAEGYDVIGADNGLTGILGAFEHSPDLVLCDVMMPELDGYEVLAALRQEPETALIPFIFLTAMADKLDVRQGMNLGADDYLTKPFSRSELLSAIATRLEKQETLRHQSQAAQLELLEKVRLSFQSSNFDQLQLLQSAREQFRESLIKLNIASTILKQLPPSEARERSLGLIHSVCVSEVKWLNQLHNQNPLQTESLPHPQPTVMA